MRAYPVVIGLVLLSFNCALAHEREPLRYHLVKLEDANTGLQAGIPRAMNNFGSMTGQAFVTADPGNVAFLWRKRQLTTIESDGSVNPYEGLGINDRGQVVGFALLTGATGVNQNRGFVWTRGKLTHIGDLPGGIDWSLAYDINLWGQVVGASEAEAGREAVLWEDGNLMSLGDLPGGTTDADAYAINEWGAVVGQGNNDAGIRPFLWRNGTIKALPVPEGTDFAWASDINNFNVAVGLANLGGMLDALMWQPRRDVKVLPLLPGYNSAYASAINDFGDVVGASSAVGGHQRRLCGTAA